MSNFVRKVRETQKEALKVMNFREKVEFYAKKKSTWVALGSIITAFYPQFGPILAMFGGQ